jgi:hypothetical protein
VYGIVKRVINEKMPRFLRSKRDEFVLLAKKPLGSALAVLGFDTNGIMPFKSAVSGVCLRLLNSNDVRNSIEIFIALLVRSYSQLPLSELFMRINIKHINDIIKILEPLLPGLAEGMRAELPAVSDIVASGIYNVSEKISADIKMGVLFKGIDIHAIIARITAQIQNDADVRILVQNICRRWFSKILSDKNLLDYNILVNDIHSFLLHFNDEDWTALEDAFSSYIYNVIANINRDVLSETKDKLLIDFFLNSVFDTLLGNMPEIMNIVDVQAIVENEINAMHPAEIERLFYKFAGRYFTKIILYGWIGAAGGLISFLFGR